MKDIRILEVTKENENRYLQKISDLEVKVLEHMEKQGKTGQLFITGKEDISAYVNSNNNTVMVAVDKNDDVIIESENLLQTEREHQQVFENARLKIYEEPDFEHQKYFEANTKNSIEIDTYITDPNNRSQGLARELVFEGIKKHLEVRKTNTEKTGKDVTIDPLELLPKKDLDKLEGEFKEEPYASVWRILVSNDPWGFKKEDIYYSEDKNYIR